MFRKTVLAACLIITILLLALCLIAAVTLKTSGTGAMMMAAIFAALSWYLWRRLSVETIAPDPLDEPGWDLDACYLPSNPKPISGTLKLDYRDANGVTTERIVDIKECDTTNPAGYLIGFCRLRNAMRTFRMDRIAKATDLETGEIIDNLADYAAQKYAASPACSLESLFSDATDALRALFFVGKADGRFTAKEKQIFLRYCQDASGDDRITLDQIENACRLFQTPSMQAFRLICGRLSKLSDEKAKKILRAAEDMIATERAVSSQEAAALAYMTKKLSPPSS